MGFFNNQRLSAEYNITIYIVPSPHVDEELSKSHHVSSLLIILIAVLGGCFLLVSYYAIIVKYCSNLKNRRRTHPPIEENSDTHHDFLDENHGPVVDHPIWYIHTVGLSQAVIDSIGIFQYKKGQGLVEGTDCAVCLSEFEEDEALRLLPKCTHAFHLSCIDTWLSSHTNCPSCRAPIVTPPVVTASTGIAPNLDGSRSGEETQVEDSVSDGGLGTDENGGGASGLSVEGQDVGEEQERSVVIEIPKKDLLSPLEMTEFRVPSDLLDNHRVVNGRQSVKRSASMDFHPASIFCFSVANMLPLEEDEGSSVVSSQSGKKEILSPEVSRLVGSSSKGGLLKSALPMKRSFSSGGKLTSSRSSQNRGSVLPL